MNARVCRICGKEKSIDDFKFVKFTKVGDPVYRAVCRKCANKEEYERRKNDPEKKEYYRQYALSKGYTKKRWAEDRRRMREDPEFLELVRHRRRMGGIKRKSRMVGTHTLDEWKALKAQHNYTCVCCGRQEPEVQLTRDHIKALAKGGTNTIDNIQPLCRSCNLKKHTKEVDYRNKD